jgi:hypothetical protein
VAGVKIENRRDNFNIHQKIIEKLTANFITCITRVFEVLSMLLPYVFDLPVNCYSE